MNYVESFNLLGVDAKQIPNITGAGAPTITTEGAVGCQYMDTLTGDIYICTDVDGGSYIWNPLSGKGGIYIIDLFDYLGATLPTPEQLFDDNELINYICQYSSSMGFNPDFLGFDAQKPVYILLKSNQNNAQRLIKVVEQEIIPDYSWGDDYRIYYLRADLSRENDLVISQLCQNYGDNVWQSAAESYVFLSRKALATDITKVLKDAKEYVNGMIVQTTGNSETNVMSQKAVTNVLSKKPDKKTGYVSAVIEEVRGQYFRAGTTTANTSWNYCKVNVAAGETYKVSGTGNGYVHAINYCDDNLNVLSSSSESGTVNFVDEEITIPDGCTILVLNRNLTWVFGFNVLKLESYEYAVSQLGGKNIVNFGDSIFGMFEAPTDISTYIGELTGANVYNVGFGGTRVAQHASDYYDPFSMYRLAEAVVSGDFTYQDEALSRAQDDASQTGALVTMYPTILSRLKSIDFNNVDIITIAFGTNDWQGGNALDNADTPKDTACIAGALRYSIETILTAYPHIKIFVCCPIYRFWNNADGTLNYDSDTQSSAVNGVLLTDIVEKEKDVANEYHLPFIDNYYELGINKFNRVIYFPTTDGTHPNADGRKLIARHISAKLF